MKKKIKSHHDVTGKKGIIIINLLSKVFVVLSALVLVGCIFGMITGLTALSANDVNYSELVKDEGFEYALFACDTDKNEFLTLVEESDNNIKNVFVLLCLENMLVWVFDLFVIICMFLVTSEIRKQEDKIFTENNLKVLTNTGTILIVLYVLQCVLSIFTNSGDYISNLSIIFIVCIFRYIFAQGYELQEKINV